MKVITFVSLDRMLKEVLSLTDMLMSTTRIKMALTFLLTLLSPIKVVLETLSLLDLTCLNMQFLDLNMDTLRLTLTLFASGKLNLEISPTVLRL